MSVAVLIFGLTDGLNSTVATVDQAGVQTGTFQYEPYGETTTTSTYPFQYTGRVPASTNLLLWTLDSQLWTLLTLSTS